MQKVVGSNPISRFKKGLHSEGFPRPPSSLELLIPRGLSEDRPRPAATPDLNLGGFAGEFRSRRTVVILQPPQKAPGSDRRCRFTIERSDLELPSCSSPRASTCGCDCADVGRSVLKREGGAGRRRSLQWERNTLHAGVRGSWSSSRASVCNPAVETLASVRERKRAGWRRPVASDRRLGGITGVPLVVALPRGDEQVLVVVLGGTVWGASI